MGHAVGHIAGMQGRAGQRPRHRQCGGTGVQKDEILRLDQGRSGPRDAVFLIHSQLFFGGHGGFVGAEGAVRQGGTAVHLVQSAHLVQLVQVAPDGGFACAQGFAQLLYRGRPLAGQQIQDEGEAFFCQHGNLHSFWWIVILFGAFCVFMPLL